MTRAPQARARTDLTRAATVRRGSVVDESVYPGAYSSPRRGIRGRMDVSLSSGTVPRVGASGVGSAAVQASAVRAGVVRAAAVWAGIAPPLAQRPALLDRLA